MTFGSKHIEYCARLGFDILTYRSVRTSEWGGLGYPNWSYINAPHQLKKEDLQKPVIAALTPFPDQEISMANSFGIQSFSVEKWQKDYEIAKKKLSAGQLLILALMITPENTGDALEDAKQIAQYANQTSADIFEINLACPNSGKESLIYEDVELCKKICFEIKNVIGSKCLLAKVGYYPHQKVLKDFLKLTRGTIDGISSTNTYGMKVIDKDEKDVFPGRPTAGVSGAAIRHLSMEQAKNAVAYKKELGLKNFAVIGIGGVTKPEHIDQYLDLGVDAGILNKNCASFVKNCGGWIFP